MEKEHLVETQWHYPILTKYGFYALTKMATGLVRQYIYTNNLGNKITCTTGVNSDRWSSDCGQSGYWSELEIFLLNRHRADIKSIYS